MGLAAKEECEESRKENDSFLSSSMMFARNWMMAYSYTIWTYRQQCDSICVYLRKADIDSELVCHLCLLNWWSFIMMNRKLCVCWNHWDVWSGREGRQEKQSLKMLFFHRFVVLKSTSHLMKYRSNKSSNLNDKNGPFVWSGAPIIRIPLFIITKVVDMGIFWSASAIVKESRLPPPPPPPEV